jgi:hypothetical protein
MGSNWFLLLGFSFGLIDESVSCGIRSGLQRLLRRCTIDVTLVVLLANVSSCCRLRIVIMPIRCDRAIILSQIILTLRCITWIHNSVTLSSNLCIRYLFCSTARSATFSHISLRGLGCSPASTSLASPQSSRLLATALTRRDKTTDRRDVSYWASYLGGNKLQARDGKNQCCVHLATSHHRQYFRIL